MKKYILFLFVFLTYIAVQCKKPAQEEQLPPITTYGANTFGCLVDGQVWIPYNKDLGFDAGNNQLMANRIIWSYSISGFLIEANDFVSNASTGISLEFNNIKDTGIYRVYSSLNTGFAYSTESDSYEPIDTFGTIHIIRLDTIQQIISGTFSFTGYTNNQRFESANITDGRFDLHYPLTIH